MLQSLSINNIVLIESLEIGFQKGFTVLTGETGAGKSILLGSLSLVLGARAEQRMLRPGSSQGSVLAEFLLGENNQLDSLLEEHGIPLDENQLRLKRVIYSDGKSRAFVNDEPAGVNLLKKIAESLVEIHGQHEHTLLFDPALHRVFLDRYGDLAREAELTEKNFCAWKAAENKLQTARAELKKSEAEEDYLRHVLKKLQELDPKPGEEAELAEKRGLLMNSDRIAEALNSALHEITGEKNIADSLRTSQRFLYRSKFAESNFVSAISALEDAAVKADEAISMLEKLATGLENNPTMLENIEERLFALKDAARKYQRPVDELAAYQSEIAAKLQGIKTDAKNLLELEKNTNASRKNYIAAAEILTEKRRKTAKKMEIAMAAELKPLKMGACIFRVAFKELPEEEWTADGCEKISFLAETNPHSGLQPINKIASGGELSRFMLALRVILQGTKSVPVMVFDEVDSGIGGAVADSVGARLAKLSAKIQVLAVTHLPQVAAYAEHHFLIAKEKKGEHLKTKIRLLNGKEQKEELARMLAGKTITNEARAAAGALIGAK